MFNKKNKSLVAFSVLALLLLFSSSVEAAPVTKRLSGLNRYQTSVAVSLDGWQQSDYVVLANGENFPDALSAATLAKKYNAPILLTQKDSLPTETKNSIQQLKAKNVFIIGGIGVVSTAVENQLKSMGVAITRLAGQDRYETDIKVAEQLDNVSEIAIVTGEDFADALSIAPIAAKKNMPIILIQHNVVPAVVRAYINSHSITKTYVIGAGSTIDDASLAGIPNVEKITGQDKYQRNLAVINRFKSELNLNTIFVATGEDFADALSGSILAGTNSNPMILVGADPTSEKKYFNDNSITLSSIKILGGIGAIKEEVINNLLGLSTDTGTLTLKEVAKKANAVVQILVKDSNNEPYSEGSGFIISEDGKVVTNYHVINGGYFAAVTLQDGTKYDVEGILGYSKEKDIAILKLKNASNLPIVQLGDSDSVQLADSIVTIGSPLGLQNTISTGIISGLNRDSVTGRTGKDIQITAAITHGSSGGALFNMSGQVTGITYAGAGTADLNFVIPINEVKPFLNIQTVTSLSQLYAASKPKTPTGVVATAISSSEMKLQWDKNSDADYYYVYRSKSLNGVYYVPTESDGTKRQYSWFSDYSLKLNSLASNTTLYFKVTAVKDGVESDYSSTISATTLNGTGFFYQLSDVPIPSVNFDDYSTSSDDKTVYYYYLLSNLPANFTENYKALLITNGWVLNQSTKDSKGNPTLYFSKNNGIVGLGIYSDGICIFGYIH